MSSYVFYIHHWDALELIIAYCFFQRSRRHCKKSLVHVLYLLLFIRQSVHRGGCYARGVVLVLVCRHRDLLFHLLVDIIQSPPGPTPFLVSTNAPQYHTSHTLSLKITTHPPLHNFLIDVKDECDRPGTMCASLNSLGSPGIRR